MELSYKLIEIIRKIVIDTLRQFRRNQPTTWNVKVVGSSIAIGGSGTVNVDGDTSATVTLKNRTNVLLNVGDEAISFSPTSNISNSVILYKK